MEANDRESTRNPQRQRRPRAARACDLCRAKKNKCDESYPCSYCKSRNATCVYQGQHNTSRRYTAEYVKQLEDELKRLSSAAVGSPNVQHLSQHVQHISEHHSSRYNIDEMPQPDIFAPVRPTGEEEISGANGHTDGVEFYGSSSSFALLSRVQRFGQRTRANDDRAELVSSLHNATFQTTPTASHEAGPDLGLPYIDYYPQCRSFIENLFSTIHYIHPVLEKRDFLQKCEALWSPNSDDASPRPSPSFIALYFSVLAVGAIVGIREEDRIDGLGNLQWSRKFFDISWACCHRLGLITSLEMVQCFFMLAKVCQNELNPHLSYMYTGFAVRTALAMGINREPASDTKKTKAQLKAESRTWWGLYSLEMEISFSIGRPDTLGADIYHNRRFPLIRMSTEADVTDSADSDMLEPPYCAIIGRMVDLARITRNICHKIYLTNHSITDMIALIGRLEVELDGWLNELPDTIRPSLQDQTRQRSSLSSAKGAVWAKRQRLVLGIRYHNIRILLFGSLLTRSSPAERASVPGCLESIQKCLESAKHTITMIYQTYAQHEFFQTWFYNATYTVFAASILLLYITQSSLNDEEMRELFDSLNMAIEILESMDESVVAQEAAKLLSRAKDKAESRRSSNNDAPHDDGTSNQHDLANASVDPSSAIFEGLSGQLNHYWGSFGLFDGTGMDFNTQFGGFDQSNPMFFFPDDQ